MPKAPSGENAKTVEAKAKPVVKKKVAPSANSTPKRRRKSEAIPRGLVEAEEDGTSTPGSAASTPGGNRRRSARLRREPVRYKDTDFADAADDDYEDDDDDDDDDDHEAQEEDVDEEVGRGKRRRSGMPPLRKAQRLSGPRPDPKVRRTRKNPASLYNVRVLLTSWDGKVFGHQRGSPVNSWWASRMDCSQAGVHAPTVSGMFTSLLYLPIDWAINGRHRNFWKQAGRLLQRRTVWRVS
jgi:hypothetical protein